MSSISKVFGYLKESVNLIKKDYLLILIMIIWAYCMNMFNVYLMPSSQVDIFNDYSVVFGIILLWLFSLFITVNVIFFTLDLVKNNKITVYKEMFEIIKKYFSILFNIGTIVLPASGLFVIEFLVLTKSKAIFNLHIIGNIFFALLFVFNFILVVSLIVVTLYLPNVAIVYNLKYKEQLKVTLDLVKKNSNLLLVFLAFIFLSNILVEILPYSLKMINGKYYNLFAPLITGGFSALTTISSVLLILDLKNDNKDNPVINA